MIDSSCAKPTTIRKSPCGVSVEQKTTRFGRLTADNGTFLGVVFLAVLFGGIGAYFPTISEMVATWNREQDYSHGFLVLPISLLILGLKSASFPRTASPAWLIGLGLLIASFALRFFSALYYFGSIDGWSIILWLGGVVALLFGSKVLRWATPAIVFLIFMVPVPYRIAGMASEPLQRVATKLSSTTLQVLGQPAIAEGKTILLGEHHLEVEQACSGLRLFVSIMALACTYLMLVRRARWEKLVLVASVVPIAILANSARIVATGLFFQWTSSEMAHKFSHDFAGWAMIPLAAAMFWCVLWYLGRLFQESHVVPLSEIVRGTRAGIS